MTKKKNKEGRPLLFKTVEALKIKCDSYFELMDAKVRPYTITGLAVHLGTSRQTLLNYEEKGEFFDTIKEAKTKCEAYAEEQLFIGKNPHGVQFAMKNNFSGWKDKQEVDHTSGDKPIPIISVNAILPNSGNKQNTGVKEKD